MTVNSVCHIILQNIICKKANFSPQISSWGMWKVLLAWRNQRQADCHVLCYCIVQVVACQIKKSTNQWTSRNVLIGQFHSETATTVWWYLDWHIIIYYYCYWYCLQLHYRDWMGDETHVREFKMHRTVCLEELPSSAEARSHTKIIRSRYVWRIHYVAAGIAEFFIFQWEQKKHKVVCTILKEKLGSKNRLYLFSIAIHCLRFIFNALL